MTGERDRALGGRVHRGRLKIENARPRAIEHGLDDRVYPPDLASHAFEQLAFGIIRIAPSNQNVDGALNPRKRVLYFVRQAGGQFPESSGVLAAIDLPFVRHRLGDIAHNQQISDYLSRIVAHRRHSRTQTLSGLFASDLLVCRAASLVDGDAGAELGNGLALIRAAEDRRAWASDDLFQRRADYV